MNENKSGYLILSEDGYYIADDPDLDQAKVIWRHKIDRKLNAFILSCAENGIDGDWIVLSMIPFHDRRMI